MQSGAQNWDSVAIGIAGFATILAAATSAGIFAATVRQESYPDLTLILATVWATISLLAYAFAVTYGLFTLFRETQAERRAEAIKSSYAVFVQVYTAVLAAGTVIYFPLVEPLLEKIPW